MALLKTVENLINRGGLYNVLRYSALPNFLVELKTGKTRRNIDFYRSFLPAKPGALVMDVGANKGNKVAAFLQLGYRVVAVEPERGSLETLRYRYGRDERVTIAPVGVSDAPGRLTLHVFSPRNGYNTLSSKGAEETYAGKDASQAATEQYEVEVVTLEDLIEKHGVPYYIKIDVEGLEREVLSGLRTPVPFISFEANLPQFAAETRAIISMLAGLDAGYRFKLTQNEMLGTGSWKDAAETMREVERYGKATLEVLARLG